MSIKTGNWLKNNVFLVFLNLIPNNFVFSDTTINHGADGVEK